MRILVFGSGRGSNYRAIVERAEGIEIEAVVVNRSTAPMIELAREFGHKVIVVEDHGRNRKEHEDYVLSELQSLDFSLIALAGYMKILSEDFIQRVGVPIVNIHPSLLPSFPGLHAQRQAIEAGVKYSGCTVHVVNPVVDGGRILDQEMVEVLASDDEESLSERILEKEHVLYPRVLSAIASGRIKL